MAKWFSNRKLTVALLIVTIVQCLNSIYFNTHSDPNKSAERQSEIDFNALLKHFQETQKRHHEYRGAQRKRIIIASDRYASNV